MTGLYVAYAYFLIKILDLADTVTRPMSWPGTQAVTITISFSAVHHSEEEELAAVVLALLPSLYHGHCGLYGS